MRRENIVSPESIPFGKILTSTGKIIDLLKPDINSIYIEDIASSLSKICRWGGNIPYFYTVAQHSCLVSWMAGPELAMAALMHDAAEAYCGDVIRPIKKVLGPRYELLEETFRDAIFLKFGINNDDYLKVIEFDDEALQYEYHALHYNNEVYQKNIEFKSSAFTTFKSNTWWWDHRYAFHAFLETYHSICKLKQPTNKEHHARSTKQVQKIY